MLRSITPGIGIEANRELIAQLIVNLLDNALRHTPPGTGIGMALTADDDVVRIDVSDHGPGIPEADRERVFARFARSRKQPHHPGHGLGLSLVAAIARAHGGTVRLDDNHPGVTVMVTLPRRPR